ncbi:MAG: glycosyltransferase family 2 protein [Phycisphaerales bacterium]
MRTLIAIPVFNEARYVTGVLRAVREYAADILVVDDGSTDGTAAALAAETGIAVIRHARNFGYGRSIRDSFSFAVDSRYDLLVTMDCDEQHEPAEIPRFVEAAARDEADIVSGSRYLAPDSANDTPPLDRRRINELMTREINERLGPALGIAMTDSFCGFKAHRVDALARLDLSEDGYAFPMQLWAQAAAARLRVSELPVRLIYKDLTRSFGGTLDDPSHRLAHYREVLHNELHRLRMHLPGGALTGLGHHPPLIARCGGCA